MKTYGEIKRFTIDGLTYIVEAFKIEGTITPEMFVPFIVVGITKKTAKKIHGKNITKNALHFKLVNTGNITTIRVIIQIIKEYLESRKPQYIAYQVYYETQSEKRKRNRIYQKILNMMGYQYYGEYEEVCFLCHK